MCCNGYIVYPDVLMPTAYSYVRFSSKAQELRDSLRRQIELRDAYLSRHPELILSEQSYQDLGVSAYRGVNKTKGRLKMFLEAVENAYIKPGSFLLVEALDRLSRSDVLDALQLFLSIINSGISIVTLNDGRVYSKARVNDNWTELIVSISLMARSREESATKAERIAKSWDQKRKLIASGEKMTSRGPAWLSLSPDRKRWVPDKEKVAIINKAFKLALEGHGLMTIANILNEAGHRTFGPKPCTWTIGTLHQLMSSESLIGTLTRNSRRVRDGVPEAEKPQPVEGYYPVIVKPETFHRVREAMTKRRYVGGGQTKTSVSNLLAGIMFCRCGAKLQIVGSRGKYRSLRCSSAYVGAGCKEGYFSYRQTEQGVISWLSTEIGQFVAKLDVQANDPVQLLQVEIDSIDRRLASLIDQLETVKSTAYTARINQLEKQRQVLLSQLAGTIPPEVKHQAIGAAADLVSKLDARKMDELTHEERVQVRAAVKQLLHSVTIGIGRDGELHVHVVEALFKAGASFPLYERGSSPRRRTTALPQRQGARPER